MIRTLALVLLISASASGCANAGHQDRTSLVSAEQTTAQSVADALVARGSGKATYAAYVATSYAAWVAGDKERANAQPGAASPTDKILIVKVVGDFVPDTHRLPGSPAPHKTMLMTVFDVTRNTTLMNTFASTAAPDVEQAGEVGAAAAPDGKTYEDLRQYGSPQQLSVGQSG
jgi:hypothetical protein